MPYQSPSDYWGIPEEEAAALPLGLRYSNNPFNVKHYRGAENNQEKWPGLMGPSVAVDGGDPQMKFDNPENGAVGGAQLLQRKYASGMTTPNSIIAGRAGWTPGNYGAARNVGALAGVGLDGDLKLDTPEGMRRMLPALAAQEHGPKGQRLMTPEFWDKATEMATGAQFASGALPELKLMNLDGSNAHRWGAPVQQPGRGAPMAVYARDESNPTEDEAWRLERLLAKDTQRTASAAPEKGGVGRFAKPEIMDAVPPEPPGMIEDVANSAGAGLVRGAAGLVGLPGTVETLGRMGISSGGNQSPMSDGTREDRQPSLMDQIAARTQNPLFQQGLGMFLAASQGKDLNEGLTAGSNRAKSMQDVMMRNLALQKQAAAQARIKEMMNNPATMGQVPPALIEIARATGDASPVVKYLTAKHSISGNGQDPSNIREWNQFRTMTPDQQRQYLTMKRADMWLDTQRGFVKPDALHPGQIDGSQINKDFAGKEIELARGKFLVAQPKLEMNLEALESQTNMAKQEIASALEDIKGGGVTSWAGIYASYAPGTTAFALSRRLLTLKALVGLDKLSEMRDGSPTGASGLGALSASEMELLTSVFGSLDQKQDAATLEKNLRRVDELMSGRVSRMREAYGKDLARFGMSSPQPARKRLRLNLQTGELE